MVKARLSALDIGAVCANLRQTAVGLRVAQVYDINTKTYIIKLSKPDHKCLLLIESGIRFHRTVYTRDKSVIPSTFTIKLRKHLRTKRLVDVQQLGTDRVVDLTFGTGEVCNHVIIEFYASGNVILTDKDYQIMTLLRTHKYDDDTLIAVRQKYPIHICRVHERVSAEKLVEYLSKAGPKDTLKQAVGNKLEYGIPLFEHCLLEAGLSPTAKVSSLDFSPSSEYIPKLVAALGPADDYMEQQLPVSNKGYVIKKKATTAPAGSADAPAEEADDGVLGRNTHYDDVIPLMLRQFRDLQSVEFPTFDEALDEYFSKTEAGKLDKARTQQESAAMKRVEVLKEDQRQRIAALQTVQEISELKARMIEDHHEEVDAIIYLIRVAVADSVDWEQMKRIVKERQRENHELFNMIHSLKLEESKIRLLLTRNLEDEDEATQPAEVVDIDINLSAHANARQYFDQRRQSAIKQQKTVNSTQHALKAAEAKAQKALKQVKVMPGMALVRKPMWFEKFHWFISSENFLVIAGRDMQQNEILVKRYLGKDDLYVHADLHGAATCIIKANGQTTVPPLTLAQAGCMSVCNSSAWDAKVVTSAWWVHAEQVSKTAPTGEYLPTGSFMIRGRKNYLPPNSLVMGFGIMFKLDEDSQARHVQERQQLAAEDGAANERYAEEQARSEANPAEDVDELSHQTSGVALGESSDSDGDDDDGAGVGGAVAAPVAASAPATTTTTTMHASEFVGSGDQRVRVGMSGMDDAGAADDDGEDQAGQPQQRGKRRITAKERRLLKKGLTLEEIQALPPSEKPEKAAAAVAAPVKQPNKPKKGKGKGKRRDKWADQDDEDRALAAYVLRGETEGLAKFGVKAATEATTTAPADSADTAPTADVTPVTAASTESATTAPAAPEETTAPAAAAVSGSDSDSEEEAGAASADEQEREEIRKLLAEENIASVEGQIAEIDKLTGCPQPEDGLLHAIGVCAPYSALHSYKYKVKLTPGKQKKGKAVQASMAYFARSVDGATPREKDLMKQIPDNELMLVMMSNIAVSTPGMFLAKRQQKQKQKQQKKKELGLGDQ
eukprot:TRINITY_DN10423_c0_g1_i1.p1 TRINITY_DN10423_c0_g1~~TRINITY_DN10423_c0_g1_i1.p1  ORF type:complete len:1065 (-),score=298.79 TRINITY_DN10423_c0_g1_i1:68-3262(-)